MFQIFRYKKRKFAVKCDERESIASDFTVEVKNLPLGLNINLKQEIKDFMINSALPFEKVDVCKVVLASDVTEKLEILQELQNSISKLAKLLRQIEKGDPPEENLQLIKSRIVTLKDQLRLIEQEYESGKSKKFLGRAFFTVNKESEVEEIVEYWKRGKIRRALERIKGVSGR